MPLHETYYASVRTMHNKLKLKRHNVRESLRLLSNQEGDYAEAQRTYLQMLDQMVAVAAEYEKKGVTP